jgi:hypothetical protein
MYKAELPYLDMKQILLLIAVYSLIINQSSKSSGIKKDKLPSIQQKQQPVTPMNAVKDKSEPLELVAPVFSYTTFRFLTQEPLFTPAAFSR